jgi:FkbM family methyltransferase
MKRKALEIVNSLVRPFGAAVVRSTSAEFVMSSAIERITKHGMVINSIIDIGASTGKWSIEAMPFFPNASFIAIEPLQERKGALKNLKHQLPKFDYILCAAGEEDGNHVTLNVTDDLDGSTVNGMAGIPRKVPVRTVDAIVSEKNLEGPFLLKFDTHGYELPILSGTQNTLKETNVIVMEVYNLTERGLRFPEMCLHMGDLGFRCYDMADPMLRVYDEAFWQMDLFFCRSDSKIFKYSQYK